jgi:hypothetical protein
MPLVTHHRLSKSQHRSYRFAFDLHDEIVKLIHTAERDNAVCITLEGLSEKQLASLESAGEDGTIDWLESNGFKTEAQEAMRRNITMALSVDLCNFAYEALNAAAKGKMTVAYSLIRKPIKENLLFLEWLLADSKEFFSVFEKGEASLLDVSRSIDSQKKKEIIQKAITAAKSPGITADELFRIRYDKSCQHGFETLCNKATHLITTFKQLKTEGQNFNFIVPAMGLKPSPSGDTLRFYFTIVG